MKAAAAERVRVVAAMMVSADSRGAAVMVAVSTRLVVQEGSAPEAEVEVKVAGTEAREPPGKEEGYSTTMAAGSVARTPQGEWGVGLAAGSFATA